MIPLSQTLRYSFAVKHRNSYSFAKKAVLVAAYMPHCQFAQVRYDAAQWRRNPGTMLCQLPATAVLALDLLNNFINTGVNFVLASTFGGGAEP
jgi:hypothetical protein